MAVCPHLAFAVAGHLQHRDLNAIPARGKEQHLAQALETGLLKVMSKMGISVARSYQSAKLFAALGIGRELCDAFLQVAEAG